MLWFVVFECCCLDSFELTLAVTTVTEYFEYCVYCLVEVFIVVADAAKSEYLTFHDAGKCVFWMVRCSVE